MNKSAYQATIAILIGMVLILAFLLYQNQKIINQQRATISAQQQQITELNAKVSELSAITPDKLINEAKTLIKDQGATFLNNFIQRVQE